MAINWNRRTYSEEEFLEVWSSSISYSEMARKLGVFRKGPSGGAIYTIAKTGKELGLTTDHLNSRWSRSIDNPDRIVCGGPANKKTLEEIFNAVGVNYSSHKLRLRLIDAGLKKAECEIEGCGISMWMGKPVPLVLDHINGDHSDNRFENLRIVCRNCDGQLDTFGRRNRKTTKAEVEFSSRREDQPKLKRVARIKKICPECEEPLGYRNASGYCPRHVTRGTKIEWPTPDEVLRLVQEKNFLQVGKSLGVSDNAVRKFLRRHGKI